MQQFLFRSLSEIVWVISVTSPRARIGKKTKEKHFPPVFGMKNAIFWSRIFGGRRHIYIYIYACCEVIIWAKFGHFRCYYLGQVGVIIWAKLFLTYKNSGFKRFLAHTHNYHFVFFCAQLSGNYLKIAFFKKGVQKLGFSIFCVLGLHFENYLFLDLLKHYKNRGFS